MGQFSRRQQHADKFQLVAAASQNRQVAAAFGAGEPFTRSL